MGITEPKNAVGVAQGGSFSISPGFNREENPQSESSREKQASIWLQTAFLHPL